MINKNINNTIPLSIYSSFSGKKIEKRYFNTRSIPISFSRRSTSTVCGMFKIVIACQRDKSFSPLEKEILDPRAEP